MKKITNCALAQHTNTQTHTAFKLRCARVFATILLLIFIGMKVKAQACKPIIQSTGSIDICNPATSVVLTAVGAITNYVWSNGVTLATNTITTSGTYTLTATYLGGCTGTASIIVPNTPAAILINGITSSCTQGLRPFSIANPVSGVIYTWSAPTGCAISISATTGTSVNILISGTGDGSFTVSYTIGGCTTTRVFYLQACCTNVSSVTYSDVFVSQISAADLITLASSATKTANFYFNGVIKVDQNFAIVNCTNIIMGHGAKFEILDGFDMAIGNSHLTGCDKMWTGIHVNGNGSLRINDGSIIEQAEIAADFETNSTFELLSNTTATPNVFLNNYIDLRFNGNFNLIGSDFNSTIFDEATGFMPSFPGQLLIPSTRARSAMVFNNVTTATVIGNHSSPTFTNLVINKHANGIDCDNSSISIINTNFNNINTGSGYGAFANSQNGFAIYAESTNNRTLTYTGLGNLAGSPNSFTSCKGGVYTKSMSATVTQSKMNVTDYGIFSQLAQSPSALNYSSNTIGISGGTALFGINLAFTGTCPINIGNNTINESNSLAGSASNGIYHSDVIAADNTLVTIINNIINLLNQTKYGIRLNNINGSHIVDNTVFCDQGLIANPDAHYCFHSLNCANVKFITNHVNDATTLYQPNGIAFFNKMSSGWTYQCNTEFRIRKGFQFEYNCTSTEKFLTNQMQDNDYGLFIRYAAGAMGTQTHNGNQWFTNTHPFIGSDGAASVNNGALPSNSQFIVKLNAPSSINPSQASVGLFKVEPGTTKTCDLLLMPNPDDSVMRMEQAVLETENGVADNIPNAELGEYLQNRNLYNSIDSKVAYTDSSLIIENYYDSMTLVALGQLQQVGKQYRNSSTELNAITTLFQANNEIVNSINNQLGISNSLIASNTLSTADSLNVVAANAVLDTALVNLVITNDSLANAAMWYHERDAKDANSKNSVILPTRNFESNQKTVHHIYQHTAALGNSNFTATETATIYSIAQQCIGYGGPAVLEAQVLYKLIDPTVTFENVPCIVGGNRWGFDDEKVVENVDMLVYPNPVNEQINIYLQATILNGHYDITITSIFGKKVYSIKDVNCKSGLISIATPNLSNGLYFLSILSADKSLSQTVKIEVIK